MFQTLRLDLLCVPSSGKPIHLTLRGEDKQGRTKLENYSSKGQDIYFPSGAYLEHTWLGEQFSLDEETPLWFEDEYVISSDQVVFNEVSGTLDCQTPINLRISERTFIRISDEVELQWQLYHHHITHPRIEDEDLPSW